MLLFCYYFFLRRIEAQRRKERSEAHLYMDVQVCLANYNEKFYLTT